MTKTIIIDYANRREFFYDTRDHIWIYLQLPFFDIDGNELRFTDENDHSKNFIFDTGAQNTIISKRRAKECGYLNLPIQDKVFVGGIGGGVTSCRRIIIPHITITNKLIIKKPSILILEDNNANINILGQDILKPYSFYFDARQQYIYFDP